MYVCKFNGNMRTKYFKGNYKKNTSTYNFNYLMMLFMFNIKDYIMPN